MRKRPAWLTASVSASLVRCGRQARVGIRCERQECVLGVGDRSGRQGLALGNGCGNQKWALGVGVRSGHLEFESIVGHW